MLSQLNHLSTRDRVNDTFIKVQAQAVVVAIVEVLDIYLRFFLAHSRLEALSRLDDCVVLARIGRNYMLRCKPVDDRAKLFKVD